MSWTDEHAEWWERRANRYARRSASAGNRASRPQAQSRNPHLLSYAGFTAGLSENPPVLSMGDCYNAPGLSLGHQHPENYFVLSALSRWSNDLPVEHYRILSNAQQFEHRIAARQDYYVKLADDSNIDDNSHLLDFRHYLGGANVIDLFSGSSEKTARLHKRLERMRSSFSSIWNIDIVAESLTEGRKSLIQAGYPAAHIYRDCANLFQEGIWSHPRWRELRRDRKHHTAVLIMGATINNFTSRQERQLFANLRGKLRPGKDYLIISDDATRDMDTLRRCYDHYFYKQFFVGGYIFAQRLSFHFSDHPLPSDTNPYANADCRIDFDAKSADETEIRMMVTDKVRIGEARSWNPRAPRTLDVELRSGLMRKVSIDQRRRTLHEAGFELARPVNFSTEGSIMPARLPQERFKYVNLNMMAFTPMG